MSPLSKGITFNIGCSDEGEIQIIDNNAECRNVSCTIALYLIKLYAGGKEIKRYPVLIGKTEDGKILTHEECEDILNLPVKSYEEYGEKKAYWLKSPKYNELDRLLNLDEYVRKQQNKLSPMQHEEIDKMKLAAQIKKNNLLHSL